MPIKKIQKQLKRLMGDEYVEAYQMPTIIEILKNKLPDVDVVDIKKVVQMNVASMENTHQLFYYQEFDGHFEFKSTTEELTEEEELFDDHSVRQNWICYKGVNEYPDDEYHEPDLVRRNAQFEVIMNIPQPVQRSPEWFAAREGMMTASDIAVPLGLNKYEPQYKIILKKTGTNMYQDNKYVHHGKKYEPIATMMYEYRYNVKVTEFGLLPHPTIPFLGASPDGICSKYTMDGKRSTLIGRMLEIKCPFSRPIKLEGEIKGEICPIYYWIQVQIQLEVCELDECDFWQCTIEEYESRDEFVLDTDPIIPYISKEHQMEKGCVIQLLPKARITEFCLWDAIYIYPPKLQMTPQEIDAWAISEINNLWKKKDDEHEYKDYVFDKILYWKFTRTSNVTINRDQEWFAENLPKLEQFWNYILFYRQNPDQLKELHEYIELNKGLRQRNDDIMGMVEAHFKGVEHVPLVKTPQSRIIKKIYGEQGDFVDSSDDERDIKQAIKPPRKKQVKATQGAFIDSSDDEMVEVKPKKQPKKAPKQFSQGAFVDSSDEEPVKKPPKKTPPKKTPKQATQGAFVDSSDEEPRKPQKKTPKQPPKKTPKAPKTVSSSSTDDEIEQSLQRVEEKQTDMFQDSSDDELMKRAERALQKQDESSEEDKPVKRVPKTDSSDEEVTNKPIKKPHEVLCGSTKNIVLKKPPKQPVKKKKRRSPSKRQPMTTELDSSDEE